MISINQEHLWYLILSSRQDKQYISIRGYTIYKHPQSVMIPFKPTPVNDKWLLKA